MMQKKEEKGPLYKRYAESNQKFLAKPIFLSPCFPFLNLTPPPKKKLHSTQINNYKPKNPAGKKQKGILRMKREEGESDKGQAVKRGTRRRKGEICRKSSWQEKNKGAEGMFSLGIPHVKDLGDVDDARTAFWHSAMIERINSRLFEEVK